MANAPRSFSIGHEVYRVSVTDELPETEDGDCDRSKLRIRVREGLPRAYERNVLVHETLHALMNRSGLRHRLDSIDGENELEEEVVNTLAEWVTDFLRDNPEWVKYVTAK